MVKRKQDCFIGINNWATEAMNFLNCCFPYLITILDLTIYTWRDRTGISPSTTKQSKSHPLESFPINFKSLIGFLLFFNWLFSNETKNIRATAPGENCRNDNSECCQDQEGIFPGFSPKERKSLNSPKIPKPW